jgi:hypothetical protein
VPESIANKKTFGKNFKPSHSDWLCYPPIKNDPEADRCTENITTDQTGDICRRYLPAIFADDICRRYLPTISVGYNDN